MLKESPTAELVGPGPSSWEDVGAEPESLDPDPESPPVGIVAPDPPWNLPAKHFVNSG